MWGKFAFLLFIASHARVLTSFCSNPAATWQVFKCTVQSYPRDAAMQQTRAMPPLGLLRCRHSLSSVSSTFPAPTFTAAFFSLSYVPPREREEDTLSQVNAHRSPGRRERESPVLQSHSDGPEGKSSVTLGTIPRSFTPFSLPCHSSHREFAFNTRRLALPSSLRRLPAYCRYRQPVSARVSALSLSAILCPCAWVSVPFRSVKWIVFGGSWTDLQWCTCTLELESHRRT